MHASEALDAFRRVEENCRATQNAIAETLNGRKPTVGKHEAGNHVHLRNVLAEADEACPRAADTIRWLIWHKVVDAQWAMHMVEMIKSVDDNKEGS